MTFFRPCPKPEPTPKKAKKDKLFKKNYESVEYVVYIKSLPCAICGIVGWSVSAHVKSRGAGGKASDLVPLCGMYPYGVMGCHEAFDQYKPEARKHEAALVVLAAMLWQGWLEGKIEDECRDIFNRWRKITAPEGFTEKVMERIGKGE